MVHPCEAVNICQFIFSPAGLVSQARVLTAAPSPRAKRSGQHSGSVTVIVDSVAGRVTGRGSGSEEWLSLLLPVLQSEGRPVTDQQETVAHSAAERDRHAGTGQGPHAMCACRDKGSGRGEA